MKKLFYSIITIGFLQININGMFSLYTPSLDQEAAKKSTLFKDGVSVADKEQSIRTKYSNIPDILLIDGMADTFGNDYDTFAAFDFQNKRLWANKSTIPKHSSNAFEWAILHETGHAQQPHNIPAITVIAGAVAPLLTGYYWGMHKSTPYANLLTKLGSKACAAMVAQFIANSVLMQAEERRADNWANIHADKEALLGGIEYLSDLKQQLYNEWSEDAISSFMPFSVTEYLMDPIHPGLDGRIEKIKKELNARFSVEA